MDSTCFDLKGTSLYAKDPLGWGRERREKPDEFDTNEKKEPDIVGGKEREGERRGHGRSQDEENSNVRKICNYFINMFFARKGKLNMTWNIINIKIAKKKFSFSKLNVILRNFIIANLT